MESNRFVLQVTWGSKKLSVNADSMWTVSDLKRVLQDETGVLSAHQKLQGLKAKNDSALLRDAIPSSRKVMMMGQTMEKVSQIVETELILQEEARKEEEERKRRAGALQRLQLMRAAEEQRERERYRAERLRQKKLFSCLLKCVICREAMEQAQAEERRVRLAQMRQEEQAEEMQAGAKIEFSMNLFRFFGFLLVVPFDDLFLALALPLLLRM
jgi:hypothetical protein